MKQDTPVNCGGDCNENKNLYVDILEKKKRNITKKFDKMMNLCGKVAGGDKISYEQEKSLDDLGETQGQLKIIEEVLTKYKDFEKVDEKDAAKVKKQKAKEQKKIKFEVAKDVSTACMLLNIITENKLVQEDITSDNEDGCPILSKDELEEILKFVKNENKLKYGINSLEIVNLLDLSANFGSKVYMMLNDSKDTVANSDLTYAALNSHYQKILSSTYFSSVPRDFSVNQVCEQEVSKVEKSPEVPAKSSVVEDKKAVKSNLNFDAKPFNMKSATTSQETEDKNVANGQGLPKQQSNTSKGKNGKNGSNGTWNGNKSKRDQFKSAPKVNRSNTNGSKPIFQPQKKHQPRNGKRDDTKSKK